MEEIEHDGDHILRGAMDAEEEVANEAAREARKQSSAQHRRHRNRTGSSESSKWSIVGSRMRMTQ
jgi:hypothetical protein